MKKPSNLIFKTTICLFQIAMFATLLWLAGSTGLDLAKHFAPEQATVEIFMFYHILLFIIVMTSLGGVTYLFVDTHKTRTHLLINEFSKQHNQAYFLAPIIIITTTLTIFYGFYNTIDFSRFNNHNSVNFFYIIQTIIATCSCILFTILFSAVLSLVPITCVSFKIAKEYASHYLTDFKITFTTINEWTNKDIFIVKKGGTTTTLYPSEDGLSPENTHLAETGLLFNTLQDWHSDIVEYIRDTFISEIPPSLAHIYINPNARNLLIRKNCDHESFFKNNKHMFLLAITTRPNLENPNAHFYRWIDDKLLLKNTRPKDTLDWVHIPKRTEQGSTK